MKAGHPVSEQVAEPVTRIDRRQHAGMVQDAVNAEYADGDEPHRHDRPEQPADPPAAQGLQAEHADENEHRERQHIGRELGNRRLDPFERAQHRDRRRDGAVAIEQRRAQNADRDDADALAVLDAEERHQRQNTALAVVVGAHDDRDVFDRRGDDERPHDEGEHAERDVGRGGAARPIERRLEGVERARADVAEDDAERAKRHRGEAAGLRSGIRWLGRDGQRVLPVGDAVGRLRLARRRSDADFPSGRPRRQADTSS